MAKYAWIITKDHLATELGDRSEVGISGPSDITVQQKIALDEGQGAEFQMRDDDGELYYTGRFIGDANSEDAFAPLMDFGTPNAGATDIYYRNAKGQWEIL